MGPLPPDGSRSSPASPPARLPAWSIVSNGRAWCGARSIPRIGGR
jgi:hypothetical protein